MGPPSLSAPPPTPAGPVGPVGPARSPDEPPRRLHPFGIVRGLSLRALLSSLPALLVVGSSSDLGFVAIAGLFLVGGAVLRVVSWTRHTYELRGGRIVERSGIVSRTERALEIERIQQIDVEQTLLDRAVGTCELRLETAADSGESELRLTVVTLDEAERLRHVLAAASARAVAVTGPDADGATSPPGANAGDGPGAARSLPDAESGPDGATTAGRPGPVSEELLVAVPLGHVVLAAVTGPRLLVVPAGVAVAVGFVVEAFQPDPRDASDVAGRAVDVVGGFGLVGVAIVALLVVAVAFAGAAIAGVLRDGGFTIVRRGGEVVVRRGLTTTRTATVPLRRVQRVSVGRAWIRRRLGYATVTIHTAGSVARGGQGDAQSSLDRSLTVPLLPEAEVGPLLEALLGTSDVPALAAHPHPARRRVVVRSALPAVVLGTIAVVASVVVLGSPGAGVALAGVALAVGVAVGLARYARLASGMGEELVAGRTGMLGTRTVLVPRRKVQGVSVTSTPFQRRVDLATAVVHVAGPSGGVLLHDVDERDAERVRRALT